MRAAPSNFCWVDLLAQDADGAKTFYGAVFGWTATDVGGEGHRYTMFRRDDQLVAGLGEMSQAMKAGGVPVVWNTYVAVEDIEEAVLRASGLGAEIMFPAQKAGENGWLAFLKDPEGTVIALWQAAEQAPETLRGAPGSACWNELNTRDRAGAEAFYGALFGWTFRTDGDGVYTSIVSAGADIGGVIVMDERWGEAPSYWNTYFATDDVDRDIAAASAAGGKVLVPARDLPAGRFAVLSDPQGGVFSIIALAARS